MWWGIEAAAERVKDVVDSGKSWREERDVVGSWKSWREGVPLLGEEGWLRH